MPSTATVQVQGLWIYKRVHNIGHPGHQGLFLTRATFHFLNTPKNDMSVHPALRRVLARAPSTPARASEIASAHQPSALTSSSSSSSSSHQSAGRALRSSPFLATKLPNGRWQKPRYSARVFKHLFVATNYGRDVPQGFVFPPGPHGRTKKLLAREESRVEALGAEQKLLDLAQQHFPPSRAAIQATRRPEQQSLDRKAYLEHQGPYSGRRLGEDGSKAFKGHVRERKRPQRQAEVEARLAKMNLQYEAYNRVSLLLLLCFGD